MKFLSMNNNCYKPTTTTNGTPGESVCRSYQEAFYRQRQIKSAHQWSPITLIRVSKLFATLIFLISLTSNISPNNNVQAQQQQVGASGSSIFLQPPVFIKSMDAHNVRENTPINEVVYTLEAQLAPIDQRPQQQPVKILYSLDGTQLFSVDKLTGQVRVASLIDRERTNDSVTFQIQATPYYAGNRQAGPSAQITITVFILDENDNPPKFERVRLGRQDYDSLALSRLASAGSNSVSSLSRDPIIRLNVSESAPIESFIIDLIEAVDVDKVSTTPLNAMCLDCEPEFELRPTTANLLNDRLDWSIVLAKQLVHIPRNNIRQLHVIVNDGKFNSSIIFEITIDDVQNKPPQFIGSTTSVISENAPIDKVIMTLQAIDGDAIALDNIPGFLQGPNSVNSKNLGRQIIFDFVTPAGQSSSFQENFKLHPLTGQLQVANKLDREAYLSMSGVLSFQVRASELTVEANTIVAGDDLYESMLGKLAGFVDRSPDASTTTEITVILVDVNDNEPHWLNVTEIAALNMNQSPNWHNSLPNDRDTGRNYQIQVYESAQPGSPITSNNELFVYDLDNDENSEFNITLVDPFNLFSVEPKRATGFAMVTIKLTSNPSKRPSGKLLDYENINERSYIIQLYATETKTNEHFSSKAQIQVNILDVNDNAPEFKEAAYIANIREDATVGKTVKLVQATDKDEISARKLKYSLHGRSAYLFDMNPQTGLVTVAKCEQPPGYSSSPQKSVGGGRPIVQSNYRPCIDYEHQRSHHLMVEASDGELSSKVPLTVFVDDASDNPPVFSLPIVDVVIEEGSERLNPPIRIEATDVDLTSVLSYSIVEGNFEGLFTINNATGEIQLTRPIRIAHDDLSSSSSANNYQLNQLDYRQQQLNKMTLVVQATDGFFTANGTVRIDILDANDNAPKFLKPHYEKEITESFGPNQHVITVRAFDLDRGNNARVSYKLERGSHGQFKINETSGEISVASNAIPFDSSKRDNYTLEIVAHDHGSISKSSSVLVHVRVLDTTREAPNFEPKIQRVTIHENTLNNTIIHRMTLTEPEQSPDFAQSILVFEPGPIEGLDKYGQLVTDSERLESIFSVSTNTGDVAVNSGLDHDFAAHVNLTIYAASRQLVSQNGAFPTSNLSFDGPIEEYTPRSVGYLIINILDDNSIAPVFASPWTPSEPELSYQMFEELPIGSILTQLVASDVDSKISHYKIEPPNDYFELTSAQSGIIVNKKVIDYDALMRQTFLSPGSHRSQQSAQIMQQPNNNIIQFNVLAFDSGLPQLSSKAILSVEILPINDWDCKFEQSIYEVHIKENSQQDTVIVQVRANDLDFGEQHNLINYALIGEQRDYFQIDSRTGVVTISNRGSAELDRERLSSPTVILTVIGRDEQQQQQDSNAMSTLKAKQPTQGRSCSATIKIHVDDVNDNPPLFSQKLYEVTAYDTDTIDVPLIKLMVRDEDLMNQHQQHQLNVSNSRTYTGHSSALSGNTFRIVSGNINDSFNITPSGMIYAIKPLNESLSSTSQPINLKIQVRQQTFAGTASISGIPTLFTDECLVRVHLLKINRYAPEWRVDLLKSITVEENKKSGTLVTQLRCNDRDQTLSNDMDSLRSLSFNANNKLSASNSLQTMSNQIRYWIKENGSNIIETNEFKLDSISGKLTTRIELDRESQEYYQLIVTCEDNGKPQSLESTTTLYITVLDVDDNKPEFQVPKSQQNNPFNSLKSLRSSSSLVGSGNAILEQQNVGKNIPTIRFQAEEQQGSGLLVGELKAIDRDLESQYQITYCIIEGNEFLEFSLDRVTGILYTNQTLDRERQSTYDLTVKAINDGSNCEEHTLNALVSTTNIHNHNSTTKLDHQHESMKTSLESPIRKQQDGLALVRIDVLDINDNAPLFKRPNYRAAVHHKALMNTLVTQVTAFDPDSNLNGTLNYKISEILMYKTNVNANYNHHQTGSSSSSSRKSHDAPIEPLTLSKPIKLVQYPFRIDQHGDVYSQQLLTQYQLMSLFVLQIEATEQAEPWRSATTKLEIYVYETNSQLKMSINLHPRLVESYRYEIETMLSNATKYIAIINRARSYHGGGVDLKDKHNNRNTRLDSATDVAINLNPSLTSINNNKINSNNNPVPSSSTLNNNDEPSFSNIHLVFVDNYRIVNPNLVMEKFDLTSAQLFAPQLPLSHKSTSANSVANNIDQSRASNPFQAAANLRFEHENQQQNDFSSLIDKIALASVQSADNRHTNPSSLIGIDWLENPSVLFVSLASLLLFIGLVMCLAGCCCTSRIKDHIIKVAMDKLVKQQTLQAKINEQVLAATNQAFTNSTGTNGQDYMLQQGGLMSSFDATKGCMNNNYENMSILHRAMESGEFIPDPNYTTLNNGRINLGAHYYDASDLEAQQQEHQINNGFESQFNGGGVLGKKHLNGSSVSLSLADELNDELDASGDMIQTTTHMNNMNNSGHGIGKGSKTHSNGLNGVVSSNHQRQRQQIPTQPNGHDTNYHKEL